MRIWCAPVSPAATALSPADRPRLTRAWLPQFGSDDSDAEETQPTPPAPAAEAAAADSSEMNALFGSDDESDDEAGDAPAASSGAAPSEYVLAAACSRAGC